LKFESGRELLAAVWVSENKASAANFI